MSLVLQLNEGRNFFVTMTVQSRIGSSDLRNRFCAAVLTGLYPRDRAT
jgi:hypothetical protein